MEEPGYHNRLSPSNSEEESYTMIHRDQLVKTEHGCRKYARTLSSTRQIEIHDMAGGD